MHYDFTKDNLSILKQQEIPSGFNPDEYMVKRIYADNNGVRVPISVLYKKSLCKLDGKNPLYLYGYGSYGISISPSFRNSAILMADRGFVFAIAHIRGGGYLGQHWYEDGKKLHKKNTFTDFIKSAEKLIEDGFVSKGNIAIEGGSAGGMLIANAINQRPELFKIANAHVPFVDVLNTMLDKDAPLTEGEFKEWGNPADVEYFNYIKSYCPYNNVKAQKYPAIFVTAGLSDPRVGYYEPAKWVAKLRKYNTSSNKILFKTNMSFGHGGASGRFNAIKERAEELAVMFSFFK